MQTSNRVREWTLVGVVVVAAVFANLPEEILDQFSINRNYLLAILALMV
ncbi:MAG: hypothetical protein HYU75_01430, partial [Betaproteobacteria bacterium]|nr:hypothetical protein [Betaproteobacteria bacterium]